MPIVVGDKRFEFFFYFLRKSRSKTLTFHSGGGLLCGCNYYNNLYVSSSIDNNNCYKQQQHQQEQLAHGNKKTFSEQLSSDKKGELPVILASQSKVNDRSRSPTYNRADDTETSVFAFLAGQNVRE